MLELPAGRLTTAPVEALGAPVWLGDSTAVLLPALEGADAPQPEPGQPLPTLTLDGLQLDAAQLDALRIVRLDRGATRPSPTGLPIGAFGPAIGHGKMLFELLPPGGGSADAQLWLSDDAIDAAKDRRLLPDAANGVTSVGFGVDARSAVAALDGDGIWVVDTVTGRGEQVSPDGWQPRWLP